jgi:hypothetical protein
VRFALGFSTLVPTPPLAGRRRMQSQPMHRSLIESMHFTSSELLKIQQPVSVRDQKAAYRLQSNLAPLGSAPSLLLPVLCLLTSEVVEVNGIEPMTSCLQSRRSPN